MTIKFKDINIDKLIINPENYRFEPVKNENDAIKTMLDENNKNIKELLKDILKNGLNPSERLMVYEIDDLYIILEGNRRATALKIIQNINILKNIDENYYNQYSKLLKSIPKNKDYNLTTVSCSISETVEEADKWVELKHTGSNGGKGTIAWKTKEKRRFKDRTSSDITLNKSNVITSLFQYIKSSLLYPDIVKQNLNIVPITTLERLLQDPLVREAVGIQISKNIIFKLYPDEEIKKPLLKILNDLINKNIVVTDIYTKNQRIDYTSEFKTEDLPDSSKELEVPSKLMETSDIINNHDLPLQINLASSESNTRDKTNNSNSNSNTKNNIDDNNSNIKNNNSNNITDNSETKNNMLNNDSKTKNIKDVKDINKRNYLIPPKTQIKISTPRINQIYKELKKLEIEKYPNSVAVLFRVFIELTIDEYIEKNQLKSMNKDAKLNKKVQECLYNLKANNLITPHVSKPVNVAVSDTNSILSINTFNSYVHNKHMYPDSTQLKNSWNNLQEFLIILLNNC